LASRILSVAKAIDDFIIDRILQPVINLAFWHLELPVHTIARVSVVLGAGIGLIWLHRFDPFPSTDFYQDLLCLGIMVIATYFQVRQYERLEPRRSGTMPAARLQGLLWRTAWLLDLAIFPFQWPVERHSELAFNFVWTLLVVLPYWIICCRRLPPPVVRRVGGLSPVTISAR
jgi:hypothetical protein